MTPFNKTEITKDLKNKRLQITRGFYAPVESVWLAWTTSELLDQWWAPKPYQAKTKSMDFREGGTWLYAMISPEGEANYCRADYQTILPIEQFSALDAFCDEEGTIVPNFPRMQWEVNFLSSGETSGVDITISFDEEADLEKVLEHGFGEGFSAGLENLAELLASQASN